MEHQRAKSVRRYRNAVPPVLSGALLLTAAGGSAFAFEGQEDEGAAEQAVPVENILVTGSRIVREGYSAPTPVTVVGGDTIRAFADTNVAEVLNTLPAFRTTQAPENSFVTIDGNIGARTVDLRGLYAQRTLVLVNGRRFIPSSSQGTVDLNLIPTSLIDRTEIVTGGASAAYGSDAVAGVVNLIMDTDLEGIRAQAQYGISEQGDDERIQFSLAGGSTFLDGRARVIAGFEHEDSRGVGSCYTRDFCAQEWSYFTNTGWPGNELPARVLLPRKTATLTAGGVINNGPLRGTQFLADATPAPFEYGMWPSTFAMVGGQAHGPDPFTSAHFMKNPTQRQVFYSHGEIDFSANLQGFAELSYGRVLGRMNGAQTRDISIIIQQDNPYLPDETRQLMADEGITSFTMARHGDDFGVARYEGENRTFRGLAGLRGQIQAGIDWDAYYQYGDNRYEQEMANNRIESRFPLAVDAVRAGDGSIVCRSSLSDPGNGCVPVNLFGVGNWDEAAKDYLYGTGWQSADITQHVAAFNLQAEPFSLPAGGVPVAAGVEYRRDSIRGDADETSQAAGWYVGNGQAVSGDIDVYEGYIETVAPILEGARFANLLELNGAIRATNYSTSGTVVTWKVGAIYEPTEELRLRATRSRDIRAPNLLELFGSTSSVSSRVVGADNAQYLPLALSGGNPDLQPERADTWTIGAVWQPSFLPNFRMSADYYDIEVEDAISQIGPQTIVDRCIAGAAELCDLVTFGGDGVAIQQVRNPWLNLDTLHVRGIDFEADYRFDLGGPGDLTLRVLGSYIFDYATEDTVGRVDRAGQTGVQTGTMPGLPRWNLNTALTYQLDRARFNLQARYIPSGKMDVTVIGPEDAGYDPSLPNSVSTNRLSDRLYLDAGFALDIFRSERRNVELYGSVHNLTNVDPPVNVYSGSATNPYLFDTVLRRYSVGVRVQY